MPDNINYLPVEYDVIVDKYKYVAVAVNVEFYAYWVSLKEVTNFHKGLERLQNIGAGNTMNFIDVCEVMGDNGWEMFSAVQSSSGSTIHWFKKHFRVFEKIKNG